KNAPPSRQDVSAPRAWVIWAGARKGSKFRARSSLSLGYLDTAMVDREARRAQIVAGLADIRRGRRVALLPFRAIPLFPLVGTISEVLNGLLGLVLFFSFMIVTLKNATALCPRCGKHFYSRRWFTNAFARKCRHCDLRLDGSNALEDDMALTPVVPGAPP